MDRIEMILTQMSLEEKIALCSGRSFWETKTYEKYGIPSLFMCDGPHGLRKQDLEKENGGVNDAIKALGSPDSLKLAGVLATIIVAVQGIILHGMRADPEAGDADYLLVLGARVYEDGRPSAALAAQYETMLEDITEIVEEHFHIIVDRNSFNFSRYATHLQYLFQRITQNATIQSDNLSLYRGLREEFPQVAACVDKVDIHLQQRWHCTLSEEERLYLMLHINRICTKEGL